MHEGHEHTHDHDHGHTHCHGEHPHHHHHDGAQGTVSDQTVALVSYMLDHNRSHAEEIHGLAHKLEAMGQHEAAALIEQGVTCYGQGNDLLAQALALLQTPKEDA